jgi:formamidopyrimidine-DNA glycosylase
MPELPEVETIMNGVAPYLLGAIVNDVVLRHTQLRWPIPSQLKQNLQGQKILHLSRRGKYLLIQFERGTLIMHMGMSGRLLVVCNNTPVGRHDHVDIMLSNDYILRYTDPRRFGAVLWTMAPPHQHVLLKSLGPEPLDKNFNATYLTKRARNRRIPIKSFIMDSKVVVGVGNIYAAEALFLARIHPETPVQILTYSQHQQLVTSIQSILKMAIKKGGSTIKDFVNSAGKPGYFSQQLSVYGRAGLPCINCQEPLRLIKQGGRSSVFCCNCQPMQFL